MIDEKVSKELLDESDNYQVVFLDQTGNKAVHEESIKLKNPFEFDLTRFVPNDTCTDLMAFFELACDVINDAQERSGIEQDKFVKLIEDFNEDEFHLHGNEVITWKVIKRNPGMMDRKAKGRPQRRAMFSYDLRFNQYPNKVIVIDSMPVDHIIEFTCWSKVQSLVNKRALWLERLFIDQSWAFSVKGVEKFFWEGRGADTFMETAGQRLHQRSNRFFVRLREFHSKAYPAIKNFNVKVSLEI